MQILEPTLMADLCDQAVSTMAHSLWQSTVIAFIAWLLLRRVPVRKANLRYGVALCGLLMVAGSLTVTWSIIRVRDAVPVATAIPHHDVGDKTRVMADKPPIMPSPRTDQVVATRETGSDGTRKPDFSMTASQYLMSIWGLGAALMLCRFWGAILRVRGWIRSSVQPKSEGKQTRLQTLTNELAARMEVRRSVRLLPCDQVSTPSVFGILWPVVLVPPAMLTGLSVDQWRIVLAHELAHVRRLDAVVNLLQQLLESFLFFNPAVWWLTRQVRAERESCCDAVACSIAGAPVAVARTLLDVAEARQRESREEAADSALVAFTHEPPGRLRDRIRRLLNPEQGTSPRVGVHGACSTILAVILVTFLMQQTTQLVVVAAGQVLSPKERTDTLSRLRAENSGQPVPQASKPTDSVMVPMKIRVVRSDGEPLPDDAKIHCVHSDGRTTHVGTLNTVMRSLRMPHHPELGVSDAVVRDRSTWTFKSTSGKLWLAVSAPGLSPQFVSRTVTNEALAINIEMRAGTEGIVRMVSADGKPVTEAQVKAALLFPGVPAREVVVSENEFISDADGRIVLPHLSGRSVRLRVRRRGYQPGERIVKLTEKIQAWELARGFETALRVLDRTTGAAVRNADVHVIESTSPVYKTGREVSFGGPLHNPDGWLHEGAGPAVARTDAEGRVQISDLPSEQTATLAVTATGYGIEVVRIPIRPHMTETKIELGRPLQVSGTIEGDLGLLQNQHLGAIDDYRVAFHNESSWAYFRSYAIVSPEGEFRIQNLMPGKVVIEVPWGRKQLVITESRSDLRLKIGTPPSAPTVGTGRGKSVRPERPAGRMVRIRFTQTTEGAPVRGSVTMLQPYVEQFAVRDNEAAFRVRVGSQVQVLVNEIVGYLGREQSFGVPAGTEDLIVNVPVVPAGGVHGTVLRADGSKPGKLRVLLIPGELPDGAWHPLNNSVHATTDGAATYFHSVAINGTYRMLVWNMDGAPDDLMLTSEFTVDPEDPILKLDLQFDACDLVPLIVTAENGDPVPKVSVKVTYKWDDVYWPPSVQVTTDSNGRAMIRNLADGTRPPDRLTVEIPPVAGNTGAQREYLSAQNEYQIRLAQGENRSGVVINSQTKEPVPNALIQLIPKDSSRTTFDGLISVTTNVVGEFELTGLEPVDYRCFVLASFPSGTNRQEMALRIRPGESMKLRLEVTPK